jgi:hypothetical protein
MDSYSYLPTLLEFRDGTTVQCSLGFVPGTGYFHVYAAGVDLGIASSYLPFDGVWRYFEMKVVIDSSAGSVEVRQDGVVTLNETGIDTQATSNAYVDAVRIGSSPNISYMDASIDDLYICNGDGSVNNDFLGDISVRALNPNGNGTTSDLVGSDGDSTDNYLLVDETTPDTADYVESSTPGDKDTYAFGDLGIASGVVYGVQINAYAQKSDAGDRSFVSVARLSGAEEDGAVNILSTTPHYFSEIRETKPGGGAWSIADVDAAEFGFKVNA